MLSVPIGGASESVSTARERAIADEAKHSESVRTVLERTVTDSACDSEQKRCSMTLPEATKLDRALVVGQTLDSSRDCVRNISDPLSKKGDKVDDNLGALAQALPIALREEGVARKSDLENLENKWQDRHSEQQKQIDENAQNLRELRGVIEELRYELAEFRGTASSAPPAAASSSSAPPAAARPGTLRLDDDNEWSPSRVLIRGFAPWGCDVSKKITDTQYDTFSKVWLNYLAQHLRKAVSCTKPYALNHQIVFEIKGGWNMCTIVSIYFQAGIDSKKIDVNGCYDLTARVEVSPSRRVACKQFFEVVDWLRTKNIEDRQLVTCPRSLRFYMSTHKEVGWINRQTIR